VSWEKTDNKSIQGIYHDKNLSDMVMLRRFVEINGFDRMHSYHDGLDIQSILKTGGFYGREYTPKNRPPHIDHPKLFKNTSTGLCCLTYNPYKNADRIRSEIELWASAHRLEAEVYDSSHSWYYPGHTCFVVIHLPGDIVFIE